MEQNLTSARIAHILEALAIDGRYYANNDYDNKRYDRILALAKELGQLPDDAPPLSQIVPVTPKVGVDGAVFDSNRRLLLIQREDSGLWALPGGAVEVGERPSEAVVREVSEETGVDMVIEHLVGVFDNWQERKSNAHHLYHLVVRGRSQDESVVLKPQPGEIRAVQWFSLEVLPGPELFHPGHWPRIERAISGEIGHID